MKNIISVFLLCILFSKINAQIQSEFSSKGNSNSLVPYTVHTPTPLPQYPAINTPIKIVVLVTSGTAVSKTNITYNVNLQQNTIDINACYYCFPATIPSSVKDTVNVGLLPAGTYTVNLKTYRTNSQTVCINKIDSTSVIDTSFTISSNVGINSNIKSNDFISIYPNPLRDKLNIDILNIDISKLQILNGLGQIVSEEKIKDPKSQIDLSHLPSGVYTLKVFIENDYKTFKILKE